MVKLTINDKTVEANEGTTILEAAYSSGIDIPHLCYFKEINEIGACRVCVVEVEGVERLVAACNTAVEEGMVIHTNSHRARKARQTTVQLILSQHDSRCPTCSRNGNCGLQTLAANLNVQYAPYVPQSPKDRWDKTCPLIRAESKCIKCMRCVQVCDKIQGMNIWDVSGTGSRTAVNVTQGKPISEADCTYCGQCIMYCPVGALKARDDTERVFAAIEDPEIITVVQVAPAVRASWAESFNLDREVATPKRMAAALRRLGFDYVFDTTFTADLTVIEEGNELIKRITDAGKYKWPMFTSCCPGWVRFLKSQYPEMTDNLSTAKSPQQMFGAVTKSYFAEKIGVDPHKIFCVSVMPCSSKKSECDLPPMNDACGDRDVDVVITTREFARMLNTQGTIPELLPEEDFDSPLGNGSGAAVIFGDSGGVMEAALRSAYYLLVGENVDPDALSELTMMDSWREATIDIPGTGQVRIAITSGLGNARRLIEAIKKGEAKYDFVEIMACPGGCAGGGGQPIVMGTQVAGERGELLRKLDRKSQIRYSHDNEDVKALYAEYLREPLGEKSHHLLHTDHHAWEMPSQS